MLYLSAKVKILILIILIGNNNLLLSREQSDTSVINKQTRNALINARRNPDIAIMMAHQALALSRSLDYQVGMADAYLALGTAWLAKYNRGDSAYYYNMLAYDLYEKLNDNFGKAMACYGLAYVFSFKGNLKESERYSNLSLTFFELAGNNRGMVNSYNVLSYLAKQQKNFDKAQTYIQKAIEIAGSIRDTLPLADAKNSLGNIYKDMTLFKQAIDAYFDALHLWELKGDSNGISIAYGSIGLMYYYQKEWDKALEFCLRKLPISSARGDLWEVSKTYNTIAQIYNSKAKFDSSLIYLRKGLQLNNQMNLPSGIASSYFNIASTLLAMSRTDSAYWYINRAINIAREINDPDLVQYYITLGNIYKSKGQYSSALENLTRAYSMGKKSHLPMVVQDASKLLSDIYSKTNRNDLAYKYLKEHQKLRDSISNDEFLKQVTRMEIQYDFDKKQRAAEFAQMEERILNENRLNQQKLYVRGLLILLVLVALISLLYIRHNRLRAKYTRIDLEQRLLRAQMNPHFIFNSLCAVQDFILAGKPQKANTFLTKIARLMRNILENSREEFIPLEKEIETVKLYLDLQQLRFENEFDYNISLDDTIDPENFSVPPMLTQPCVENSIEHGLLPLKEKGHLKITYSLSNGLMMLEVTDNGVGRKEAAAKAGEKRDKKSISTKVTTERLENFRKTLKQKSISYEIIDLYDKERAAGTKVVMMLPYKKIYA
ncbi:MAG: tetratricopeptide repeat protein [Bacteroidales bacterium]|nr:tetratricopeptide repeat protein [Bacteroidales bacterium]